tara:strand:+ start:816 stop:1397 length:582 start_codon:yes stop_codon:yes gene_type:complete
MIDVQNLFVTPVMMTELKGYNHLVDRLYEIRKEHSKGMPRSNVGGWHSHDKLYGDDMFTQCATDILKNAEECFKQLDVQDQYIPEMSQLWGMINPPGSSNNVHTHPCSYLSGVLYLKVPENSGEIVFLEPKPQAEVFSPPKQKNKMELSHSVGIQPKEDTLIFFPSWLQHYVQKNQSNQDRIVLSFNINWRLP